MAERARGETEQGRPAECQQVQGEKEGHGPIPFAGRFIEKDQQTQRSSRDYQDCRSESRCSSSSESCLHFKMLGNIC
jgi:hypothetical protein